MVWPFQRRLRGAPPASPEAPDGSTVPGRPHVRRRIAVIGASGFETGAGESEVRCFPWSTDGDVSAVADFDIAVVTFADAGLQADRSVFGLPPDSTGTAVFALLKGAERLVRAGGEVVVIGRPDTCFRSDSTYGEWASYPEWTGMRLTWDFNAGDRVERAPAQSRFDPYLACVRRYDYSLRTADGAEVRPITGGPIDVWGRSTEPLRHATLATTALLTTRHGGMIASMHVVSLPTGPASARPGRVVLLPPLVGTSDGGVGAVLRDVYGIEFASPAPAWLESLPAPGEPAVNSRARLLQHQLTKMQLAMVDVEAERSTARRTLGLLTLGDAALEDVVRASLRSLGADVIDPAQPNKEDGRIVVRVGDETFRGVLEIKSTQKEAFDEGGLRQLQEWKAQALRAHRVAHKGIFIGNSAYRLPPDQRRNPFGKNFRDTARTNEVVALETTVLLNELRRVVDEGMSPTDFWRRLFTTNGVLD